MVVDRAGRWWRSLRVVLLVMWLVAVATIWWSAPRHVGYGEARAAVAEKRLTEYQWGDSWDSDSAHRWFDGATLLSTGTRGPIFAWRSEDGRVRWTDTDDFGDVDLDGVVDQDDYAGPGAAGIAQELVAAGIVGRDGSADVRPRWTTVIAVVISLVLLGVVVAGPAPVLGTRWYWFWLAVIAPYALGLVFWMLRDRPWSRAARPVGGPGGRDRGWRGLLLGIVVSILFSVVVGLLNGLLGDRWVP